MRSVLMRSVEMRSPGFADRPRTRTAVATSPSATKLLDRADRNLEHLFTLLALLLPEGAVRIAFRALHTDDPQLKGTAFEYLESATPPATRQLLLPMLEADADMRSRRGVASGRALENLLATTGRINRTLNLEPLEAGVRQ